MFLTINFSTPQMVQSVKQYFYKRSSGNSAYFKRLILCLGVFLSNNVIAQEINSSEWYLAKYTQVEQKNVTETSNYVVIASGIKSLQDNGFVLLRALSANAAIFCINDSLKKNFLISNHYHYAPANDVWKFSSQLEAQQYKLRQLKSTTMRFTVVVKNAETFVEQIIKNNYAIKIVNVDYDLNALIINCDANALFNEILPRPDVLFADIYQTPNAEITLNGFYKTINFITAGDYFYPKENGQNITIGIKENNMNENDIDLRKRILPSSQISQGNYIHATTISTLAGGAGNSFISGKGVASECNFYSSAYSNLFADNTATLIQNNVTVQNHSYGTVVQSFYGAEAMSYDVQTNKHKSLLHIFSSGNKGADTSTTGIYAGIGGFANITGNFKMAKNVMSIAAIDTGNHIATYSSSGPMYDGRVAPQLAALGANGTSEAAAIVSGACAKLQQIYKDDHAQQLPTSSLIKAILFCTANEIDSSVIDFRSGYGALNILRAIECLENNSYDSSALKQGDTWVKTIVIAPHTTSFKIALAWNDTAALVNSYIALSNDLDLELKEISSGKIYKPWCLNSFPHLDSLKQLPTRKRDTLNTAELISIDMPAAGAYEIKVQAAHIITNTKQDFNIAFTWESSDSFRFVSPLQQSDFFLGNKAAAQIKINWLTGAVAATDTGTLAVTMDDGITWQILASALQLSLRSFDWQVPDTNAFIRFRMNTAFGIFYSPQILLGPLSTIFVNYLCTDSFQLSWNSQPYASSYRLFVMSDSAYLKALTNQADTFIVLHRNKHPENIYAVQPILNNNTTSARSFAVDITNQGVGCMYGSFYGIPVGDIVELTMELSFPQGIDSVVIEKLNANSIFEKEVTSVFPTASVVSYSMYDKSPTEGANNYRAKIWFDGHFIYTETITIVYAGKQWLFLYPNPLIAGQPVFYSAKESIEELLLIIYSVQGQLLSQYFINSSGSLSMNHFSPGIYLYSLLNSKNEQLQHGKLMLY